MMMIQKFWVMTSLQRTTHPIANQNVYVCAIKIHLTECFVFELKIGKKIFKVVLLYRSLSQSNDELETFLGVDIG